MNRSCIKYNLFPLFLLIIILSVFSFLQIPSSDDFCSKIEVMELGVLDHLRKLYFGWTGRVVSSATLLFFLKNLSIKYLNLISFFNLFSFLGTIYFIKRILLPDEKALSLSSISFYILCMFIILIGMRPHIGEFVFWPTGGLVYIYCYFIFFMTLSFLRNGNVLFSIQMILIFISSLLIETVNPVLFLFIAWDYMKRRNRQRLFWSLISFFLGSSILYLSPGNFARAEIGGGMTSFSMLNIISNAGYLIYKSLRYIWLPCLLAISAGFIFANLDKRVSFKKDFKFLFLVFAFASLSPLILAPKYYNGRSSSFFVVLLSIYFFMESVNVFQKTTSRLRDTSSFIPSLAIVMSLIFGIDCIKMIEVKKAFISRHEFLQNISKGHVIVPSIPSVPVSSHLDDITTIPSHWINQCVAKYYGLKSLKRE